MELDANIEDIELPLALEVVLRLLERQAQYPFDSLGLNWFE
jgi:hypothetical protein